MKIQILQMIEGARKARGLTVVIDVFRAFSLECYLMAKHPSRLCPVGAEQTARDLKMQVSGGGIDRRASWSDPSRIRVWQFTVSDQRG